MNNDFEPRLKRYPPYGRQLEKIRQTRMIPAARVIFSTRWALGAAYPRIVIPNDMPIANLNFSYLAGLSVQIIHGHNEDQRVRDLINMIIEIKPRMLAVFNFELAKQNNSCNPAAYRLVHPKLVKEQYVI